MDGKLRRQDAKRVQTLHWCWRFPFFVLAQKEKKRGSPLVFFIFF
jgi:hypothetical protein